MKLSNTCWLLVFGGCWTSMAGTQLQLLPFPKPQDVFCNATNIISLKLQNSDNQIFDDEIHARILQTSSATTVLLSENSWKRLQVPANETVLASVQLDFPPVKAETKFLVQWLVSTNIIGDTEVLVYPTNLLAELQPLAGNEPIGIYDPQNQLKPLLQSTKVNFKDLEVSGIADFHGRLAIIGPFTSHQPGGGNLGKSIKKLALKGAGIVWIQPPLKPQDKLRPSFYTVPAGTNAVVIVQADLLADLAEQPQAQLRLLQLARLALASEPPALPQFSDQP